MPELPEVETVRRGLQQLLPGRVIADVSHDWPKSFPNTPEDVRQFVIGASVITVERRAKVLLVELSSKYSLVVHLKMTGQLVFVAGQQKQGIVVRSSEFGEIKSRTTSYEPRIPEKFGGGHPSDSLIHELPDKTTRVTIAFADGSKLFFNDQRKFGWVRLLPTAEVPNIDFFKRVGPEPLAADFTADILFERLQRRKNTSIKAALLDQTVLAGIGNIYSDESLWGAKIHPATLVKHLSQAQVNLLYKEIVYVLKLAIEKGGSTDKNYVNAEGKRGSYLSFARVFRREGQPCLRCTTTITKTKVAGRGTHICPTCQPANLPHKSQSTDSKPKSAQILSVKGQTFYR